MPQFLLQTRRNGNIVKQKVAENAAEVAAYLKDVAKLIETTDDPELIQSLSLGIRQVPDGSKTPQQFHGIVLFTISPEQADTDEKPTLAGITDYLEQAVRTDLDCDEHGNPFGFANPVILPDTIVPAEFDLPNVDPLQVCSFFRRRGYRPNAVCYHNGQEREIISYPYPTDTGVGLCIRVKDDPTTLQQVDLTTVSLNKPA